MWGCKDIFFSTVGIRKIKNPMSAWEQSKEAKKNCEECKKNKKCFICPKCGMTFGLETFGVHMGSCPL